MLLAGMFFPAMLIVICKSQSPPNDNNLLLPEKTADLYAPTGRLPVDSLIINNEDLLDKYRQFVAKSLVRLHDSCKLHDFLRNINMLPEDSSNGILNSLNGERSSVEDLYLDSLLKIVEKNKHIDVTSFLRENNFEDNSRSAITYYLSVSLLLHDTDFDQLLRYLLHEKCCKGFGSIFNGDNCLNAELDKRNTIKKVKFHSWGGKRNGNGGSDNRRTSNSDLTKDSTPGKVVIRTPFRPWGGKRQPQQETSNNYFDVVR